MQQGDFYRFLRWAAPRLGLRPKGFRKPQRQVRRRVARRMAELGIADLAGYRDRLLAESAEWRVLDGMCRISISRFWRDADVFDSLAREVLPELARRVRIRGESTLRCWSAGCASGEEPYSLALIWRLSLAERFPALAFDVLATDASEHMLHRARAATYPRSSLRELPADWRDAAFEPTGDDFVLRKRFRAGVRFEQRDLRETSPAGPFDLVLCRNLALTYFDRGAQDEALRRLHRAIVPDGALVIGRGESMPWLEGFRHWDDLECVRVRVGRIDPIEFTRRSRR